MRMLKSYQQEMITTRGKNMSSGRVDCEQSLFFFRFSGHLRFSRFARRTTEKRETARSLRQGGCLTKDVSNKIHTLMALILTFRDN